MELKSQQELVQLQHLVHIPHLQVCRDLLHPEQCQGLCPTMWRILYNIVVFFIEGIHREGRRRNSKQQNVYLGIFFLFIILVGLQTKRKKRYLCKLHPFNLYDFSISSGESRVDKYFLIHHNLHNNLRIRVPNVRQKHTFVNFNNHIFIAGCYQLICVYLLSFFTT